MPNTFINIDYDDMENSHKKLRIAAVKGLDLFLAVFILLYSLFEVINGGMSFTAVWEFSSLAVFSFFAFIVNTSNYNKLSVVNIITALIFFSVLNYLNPKNEALMLLTLMFYLLSTAVWRRFYSFVFGSAFMAVMLCLYFRGVTDSDYASALPFMLGYMFLSYLLIAGTMLFKYVVRDMADSFAEEKKSINAVVVEKDNFIKKYSHNIRTSLSNIVGFVTLLTKEVSEHQKKFLDTIMAMVQNIVGVMELINIQSESGSDNEMSGKKEDCDLEELILSSAEFIGVAVKIKTEEPLPLFHADTVVIRRLFMSVFDFFKRRAFGKNSLNISVNIGKVKIPPVPVKYRFDILVSDMLQFSDDGTPGYINLIEKLVTYLGGNMKCNFGEESSLLYFNICLDEVEGGAARRSHSYGSSFMFRQR